MAVLKAAVYEASLQGGGTFIFPTITGVHVPLNVPNYSSGSSWISTPVLGTTPISVTSNALATQIEGTSVITQSLFKDLPTVTSSDPPTIILTLKNGYSLRARKASDTYIMLFMYDASDTMMTGYLVSGNPTDFVALVEIDETDNYDLCHFYKEGINYQWWVIQSFGQGNTMDFLEGTAPIVYNWIAWDQLNGNNGQYRSALTKVSNGVVEDVSTHYQRSSSSFSRISQQSSIMNIIQNSALDVERSIAYSGNAKLTLEVKAGTQSVSRKLVYRFYEPNGTTPLYSLEQVIYLAGNTPTNDVLLMFVHDDIQQAAAFLPVEKVIYQGGDDQFIFGDVSPTETEMLYIWLWLQFSGAGEPEYPYDTGSTDDGGNPAGNIGGDHIQTPTLPTLGGMSSGFFTVYCPTESQLAAIAQYLWSDNVITNIRKYFTNFSDNIISLYVLPYKSTSLPYKNFKVGNMEAQDITNVEYITNRFVDIDMGSVYVENEYDSYLDYSPYTKFDCFLPAIGVVSLDADDIMCVTDPDTGVLSSVKGSTVSLKYTLDLMTGIVVAFITINGEMRYQFSGKVGYNIPLTGENYSGMATGFVTAVAGLVGTVATGGMTAPMSASAAVAGTINAMKPEIHRGGNLTGDASLLGGRTPYLIYRRPNKPLLEKQSIFTGFPSYKSGKLTNFTGYTEVIDAHVEGISCTETERAEILTLLKSGVII